MGNQNANRLAAVEMANGINNKKYGMSADLLKSQGNWANDAQNIAFQNYTNVINQPLSMLAQLNKMGGINQAQTQSQLDDATNRWNFNQQAPYDLLANYAAAINPSKAWGNTYTQNVNSKTAGGTSNMSQAIGLGTSAAALAAAANSK